MPQSLSLVLPQNSDRTQSEVQWFQQVQQVASAGTQYGTTHQRPSTGLYVGRPYFDTTINSSITWNGTTWVAGSIGNGAPLTPAQTQAIITGLQVAGTPTGVGVPTGATLPLTGVNGQFFFDVSNNTLYQYGSNGWQSVGVPTGATLPATGINGQFFANSANGILYQFNGGHWVQVGVGIGSSLPATGVTGQFFANSTNGQLYLYNGAAWVAAVPAVNITGQLTAAQIASITAAQLTGQITTTQITNNAITTPLINAGAVNTAKLAAGAVTASTIASGTITATQIAAGTITGTNIAAGTLTANNILANTITAAQIATGTITATQIAASTITAANIASGTITATQIAASTITGGNIAAGAITATNGIIANLAVNTLQLANNAVTIPVGATASGSPASCTVTLTQAGSVQVIGFINFINGGSGSTVNLSITINGGSPTGTITTSINPGYSGCSSTSAIFSGLAAGTYTFALAPTMGGTSSLISNSIIAIGIMK
jgi:hypothetical protein